MYKLHLSTGVTVTIADVFALQIRDAMQGSSARLISVTGSVSDRSSTTLQINPQQVVLLERL
jgi:hypothetical protein